MKEIHSNTASPLQQQQPNEEAANVCGGLQEAYQPVCSGCHGNGVPPQVQGKKLESKRGEGRESPGEVLLTASASSNLPHHPPLLHPVFTEHPEGTVMGLLLMSGVMLLSQAENIMFLELDVSPPTVFEMEFSHDQDQDPRALHMERLMRLDSFLERPSTSKVRKSRSWSVPP